MKKKFTLFLSVAMLCVVVALSGCSGDRNTTGDSAKTDPDQNVQQASGNSESLSNSITVGIPQDLDGLDPHTAVAAGTREVLFNLYEGLLKIRPNGDIMPAIAESYEISQDGLTYTFKLREGVKFHDGRGLSAEDVKYSLDRLAGKGSDAILLPTFAIIDSVNIVDEKTVEVKLTQADAEILYSFTANIIPKLGEKEEFKPIGTGPFKFVKWTPQDEFVMVKFEDYWGTKAHLDDVTFKIVEDSNLIATKINSGVLDLFARIDQDQANQVMDRCNILEGNMNLVQALYLNNAVKPLDDVRVRRALNYAVNRQEILDLVFYGKGKIIGSSMIAGFSKYYLPELENKYPHDVEKAKALLAEAGYPNGFDLEIAVPGNYKQHVDTAQVIAEQLKQIGVNVNIKPVEWSVWLSDVYGKKEYQSTVIGFDARNMSADSLLYRFASRTPEKKNFNNFKDAAYDEAYELAKASVDLDEQAEHYKTCQRILSEQAANVYIQDIVNLVALNKNYEGFEFYPLYILDMSTIKRIK